MENSTARIGIDLGGTKIEGIALSPDGRELSRLRIPTPTGNYTATVHMVADLVRRLKSASRAKTITIGVGIPGAISPATGLVKNANSTCLIGKPLDHDLETAVGQPVRLENDANCFTVSEAADGAAAGAGVVFGVILGTGVGGGVVVNGRPLHGRNAIGGEWGHNPMPGPQPDETPGAACYCGQTGCIETFLSGPGLAKDHGKDLTANAIADAAQGGDLAANAALARYEERLARALASVINLLDPDVIVLGGGLSNIERLYTNVPRLWNRWTFSDQIDTPLVRNQHGDSSGVRGAAWLWPVPPAQI